MLRTIYNGQLRLSNVGQNVELVGWVAKKRNLGSLLFIDLRDRTGIIQLLINSEQIVVPDVRNEYLLHVFGVVKQKAIANNLLATGEVEVEVSKLEVINKAETTPLIIANETDALEEVRLKYRYLDLRRPTMQDKLIKRAQIVRSTHQYLDQNGFIEIETPILTKSTPGGARDFLVASRLHPGSFYALPQSPQIYKQLLMISGLERYYQIAKCFRDEDLRADRQPDFTQIDLETSFLNQDEILTLTEGLLHKIFLETVNYDLPLPLPRLTYEQALHTYGSDKPDLRYGLKIVNIKDIFENNQNTFFVDNTHIIAIKVANFAEQATRKVLDNYNLTAKKFKLASYAMLKYSSGELVGSLVKLFSAQEILALKTKLDLTEHDVVFIAASPLEDAAYFGLGALRTQVAKDLNLIDDQIYSLLWVTDFPLFETSDEGRLVAAHHPFTRPHDEDLALLKTNPAQVRAQAYDIVINGYEAGGGSLRIYDRDLQNQIFTLLGMSEEAIRFKFGFFVDAFNYGTPPHGGIALGLDRMTMILTGTDNIRDVIAFPKNLAGVSPMSEEPTTVDQQQLIDLHLKIVE